MKIERTRNAMRNVIFGIIQKLYMIFVPFVMRTIMIYILGVEYLGLNSLFVSILQVLNLAELGVGNAMIFSMYKPIAEDDHVTICALMNQYRKYYRCIGLVIAIAGSALTPFVPYLISGDVPSDVNVYYLYWLNLATTVFSYWLFGYKNSLFTAHQRNDIISKISMIVLTLQYVMQIVALCLFKNYYAYLIIALAFQIIMNITTAIVAERIYPNYKPKGKLDIATTKDINRRIRDLFTAKLGGTIVNSADTIVISAFLGLEILAIYQNYYYIMTSVIAFILIIFNACTAGIGNSLITETTEKNYSDFRRLSFLTMWILSVCVCCFACIYQPFMKLWVGADYMFDMITVVLFCMYFYIYMVNQLACVYKDAGGVWHQDRFRPLISALTNLILNLILVNFWGIYAILLSTIISYLVVALPWLLHNLFTNIFKRSPKEYIISLLKNMVITCFIFAVCVLICQTVQGEGISKVLINLLICLIFSNVILLLIYHRDPLISQMLVLINSITNGKFQIAIGKIDTLLKSRK